MKRTILVLIIIGVIAIVYFLGTPEKDSIETIALRESQNMKITSPAFKHNEFIPKKYTCDGEDINPPLEISGVPPEAKSLALIVDDPDAPVGLWVHWTIWNIDPETNDIPEGGLPNGISLGDVALGPQEGTTDFGRPGYGGPCPPFNPDSSVGAGTHRYFFKIYALNEAIPDLDSKARKTNIEKAMEGHILNKSEFIGLYSRK